ncbi:Uncharacterized conserved protein [Anaerobiospirillum thomasii]|uniref:Uncharacterized conserved protein n=1 Tax=Anaerobiospirillum thomasii TaxID=179995 RepID=A0A2X0V9U9_9GAMM|nr:heme-binding protein [Anaerobiospirillum thomasii]SPT68923.1 Uncharacterized conserved protein [Anaerobiospirillum thomasii]SPT71159.1 Uncharacterized conserved protein [Anaerobiospirillum thomasii]
MYRQETLDAIVEQEQLYKFKTFDHTAAIELGSLIIENSKDLDRPIATKIIFDDLEVFACFKQGTNEVNNRWLMRKTNTVKRTQMASLHVAVLRHLKMIEDEPWHDDEDHYALVGGGFPIVVNGLFRGIALVSGLPHLRDHQYLTNQIATYLGQKQIEVPVFNI